MTVTTHPLTAITVDDVATYERDGVVCLRQVLDKDWLRSLKPWVERIAVRRENIGLLPTTWNRNMVRLIPEFRRFIFESPLGEAVGRLLGSSEIRFYYDEIFAKAPN